MHSAVHHLTAGLSAADRSSDTRTIGPPLGGVGGEVQARGRRGRTAIRGRDRTTSWSRRRRGRRTSRRARMARSPGSFVQLARGGPVEAEAERGRGDYGGGATRHGAQVRRRYQPGSAGAHGRQSARASRANTPTSRRRKVLLSGGSSTEVVDRWSGSPPEMSRRWLRRWWSRTRGSGVAVAVAGHGQVRHVGLAGSTSIPVIHRVGSPAAISVHEYPCSRVVPGSAVVGAGVDDPAVGAGDRQRGDRPEGGAADAAVAVGQVRADYGEAHGRIVDRFTRLPA